MSYRAEVLELKHPLVIKEDRAKEAIKNIREGKHFSHVFRFKIPNQAQDVTPEALRHLDERYTLFVSNEGDGMVQINNTKREDDQYQIKKGGLFYLMNRIEGKYDEGDGEKFMVIYEIIDLKSE